MYDNIQVICNKITGLHGHIMPHSIFA